MKRLLIGLAATSILAATAQAHAKDPTDLEAALAEPVVQGASEIAEDQSNAPSTLVTVTADDLRRYGIKSLDEAINYLSLGMLTQDNLDGAEFGSRGVLLTGDFGNHALVLVNGHAMNEQWGGTAYFGRGTGIPLELVDHIEMIIGPGSVLYGSYAMLGVINIVTKAAKDFEGLHLVGEMDVFTTWRTAVGFGKEFKLFGKPAEITGEVEYFARSGPALFFNRENYGADAVTGTGKCFDLACTTPGIWPPGNDAARNGGAYANNSYYANVPSGYLRMVWGNFELDLRGELFKRAFPYQFGAWDRSDGFETDKWLSGDLKHRWAISPIAELRSRLYGDTYEYYEQLPSYGPEDCLDGQTNGCMYTLHGASRWAGLEEQLLFNWLKDGSVTTMVGVDGRIRFRGSRTDSLDLVTGQNPGSISGYQKTDGQLAAYLQQTWQPTKWLGFNAGARLDAYEGIDPKISPRATIAVKPWKGTTIKGIYSEAFRAPTAYESLVSDGISRIPAPDLRPETVRSIEATIEHRFGQNRILFGAFRSWWFDLILAGDASSAALQQAIAQGLLPATATQATQYQNLGALDNYGFNGSFEGAAFHRDLRYGINVTGAYSRYQNTDGTTSQLPVTPQIFGNARISYDLPNDWPVIAAAAFVVGKRPADQAFTPGWSSTPYAPVQVDLRFTISGPVPKIKGLSYRLIADYQVASRGPYVVGPATFPTATDTVPQLVPVDQFRTTVGLQYDIR